jgi:flagellar biosynthesis/type III secretory pathway M-ring protein FliF/YscJ
VANTGTIDETLTLEFDVTGIDVTAAPPTFDVAAGSSQTVTITVSAPAGADGNYPVTINFKKDDGTVLDTADFTVTATKPTEKAGDKKEDEGDTMMLLILVLIIIIIVVVVVVMLMKRKKGKGEAEEAEEEERMGMEEMPEEGVPGEEPAAPEAPAPVPEVPPEPQAPEVPPEEPQPQVEAPPETEAAQMEAGEEALGLPEAQTDETQPQE